MSGGHTQKKKKKRRSVDCGREDEKIALQKNSRAGSCCCSSHGLLIIDDSICTGGPLNQDYVTCRDPSRPVGYAIHLTTVGCIAYMQGIQVDEITYCADTKCYSKPPTSHST